jgi:predicted kinase
MGLAGAGKSTLAARYVERGYERLNRDEIGGTLRGIAQRLDERLGTGTERVVLDNTYVTRAARSEVVRVAQANGARVTCVLCDTPIRDAEINVVARMVARWGKLLAPEELAREARRDPGLMRPTVLSRMRRELEVPTLDEGFAEVEIVPFERAAPNAERGPGVAIALERAEKDDAETLLRTSPQGSPCLVFGWRPDATEEMLRNASAIGERLAARTGREVDVLVCTHPAGPPICWCRPPLPGLWIAFAERRGIDSQASVMVGASPAHDAMARALGMVCQ